jgi:hypothetical protein
MKSLVELVKAVAKVSLVLFFCHYIVARTDWCVAENRRPSNHSGYD